MSNVWPVTVTSKGPACVTPHESIFNVISFGFKIVTPGSLMSKGWPVIVTSISPVCVIPTIPLIICVVG